MEQLRTTFKNAEAALAEAVAARLAKEDEEAKVMARFSSDMSETNRKAAEKAERDAADARRIEKALVLRHDQAKSDLARATREAAEARVDELQQRTSFGGLLESCEEHIRELLALDERARPIIGALRAKVREAEALRSELISISVHTLGRDEFTVAAAFPPLTLNDLSDACCLLVTQERAAKGASKDVLESFVYTVAESGDLQNRNVDAIRGFAARLLKKGPNK